RGTVGIGLRSDLGPPGGRVRPLRDVVLPGRRKPPALRGRHGRGLVPGRLHRRLRARRHRGAGGADGRAPGRRDARAGRARRLARLAGLVHRGRAPPAPRPAAAARARCGPQTEPDPRNAVNRETRNDRGLVIIPTYNERENLPRLVPMVLAQDERLDVLVIDDASPDGTGAIADQLAAEDPRVNVLHRRGKLGLGTAYLEG